ncbi:MAG: DUF2095 family protein [Candidatus Bathyarchaeia archaeon]
MIDRDRFRKLFPHLAEEMEKDVSKVPIDQFRTRVEHHDRLTTRKWAGYDPDVVDFIRRCDTEEEAEEIITYMENRGEIGPDRAAELRERLRVRGLRSFGEKKERDFYHHER